MITCILKRLRSLAFWASFLLFLSFLYSLHLLIWTNYENTVVINLLPRKQIQTDDFEAESHKCLSLLGNIYKKSLQQYEIERMSFGKRFKDAMQEEVSLYTIDSNPKTHDLKQNRVCSDNLFLLIQVHSAPENFMSRQAIRLSWGSMDFSINYHQGTTVMR